MSLPISNKEIVHVTPKDSDVTYLVEVPNVYKKAAWRRDVLAAGVKVVSDEMIYNSMRDGVNELVDGKERDSLIAVIDTFEQRGKDSGQEIIDLYTQAAELLRKSYKPFTDLLADKSYSFDIQQIECLKHFLCGIEGFDIDFYRVGGKVADEILNVIPDLHALEVALKILSLMDVSKAQAKNLKSQSQSTATPKDSTAEENHLTEGKAGN